MTNIKIYLSGSIKKGSGDTRSPVHFWTEEDESNIVEYCGTHVELLNPAKSNIRRNDYHANYGCDLFLVRQSDVVLVDLRTEKGIGIGAELMFARYEQIPVVGWAPRNSQYRKDRVENVFGEDLVDWIHPFAFGLCDYLEPTLEAACGRIKEVLSLPPKMRKRSPEIEGSIRYFCSKYPEWSKIYDEFPRRKFA